MESQVEALAAPVDSSPLDYHDDGPMLIAVTSVLAALAMIAVALRFWAKRLGGFEWKLDDWLALAALLMHGGCVICGAVAVDKGGLGRDLRLVVDENPSATVILYESLFASEITYGISATAVKLSVLMLYWNLFPTRRIQLGVYILGSMSIAWTIGVEITILLQCRPLEAFWRLELQALPETRCLDKNLFFFVNSFLNTFIDLATLVLPIQEVVKLRIKTSKKLAIAGIFLLGGLSFFASFLRTVTSGIMWKDGDINFSKQFVVPGVTSGVEIYVAIIGACLPVLMPVYRRWRYGKTRPSTKTYIAHGVS